MVIVNRNKYSFVELSSLLMKSFRRRAIRHSGSPTGAPERATHRKHDHAIANQNARLVCIALSSSLIFHSHYHYPRVLILSCFFSAVGQGSQVPLLQDNDGGGQSK